MPRLIPVLVRTAFVLAIAASGGLAAAQSVDIPPPVSTHASISGGRILGVVRDDAGQAIGDVSVIALGAASVLARTDARGRFSLSLAPGEYILRASHDRYISTYREAIRIQASARLERDITLMRPGLVAGAPVLTAAMAKAGQTGGGEADAGPDHSHSETAWRLRHLPRTVLRDGSSIALPDAAAPDPTPPHGSLFDRAVVGSARLAVAYFADADFSGQINVLTSGAIGGPAGWRPDQLPRGVAYLAVGAQAGDAGDWRMRAAVSGGNGRSPAWVMLGEFSAPEAAAHAFRVGVSYGSQGDDPGTPRQWQAAASGSRGVAGVYGFDVWRVRPGVTLDYGVRLDRYDYLSQPELVSPRLGAKLSVLPRTSLAVLVSRRLIAPGAEEFLPPPASGPWVPPERTFSALLSRSSIRPEDVRHYEISVERDLTGGDGATTVLVRRFRQTTRDQGATIFGHGTSRGVGHYYVATPGTVELDGWGVGLRGRWRDHVKASIDYTLTIADWAPHRQARIIRRVAPTAARAGRERLHDVQTTLDAAIPETATRVTVVVRTNSGFSRADGREMPVFDGRFDVEIRQALPYQPIEGGRLEVLFGVRTLFRDWRDSASLYDEVLTVAPPLRLVGGFQIRF